MRGLFDRNVRALGEDGQQRLFETTVAVIGCGGIGSVLVDELVRLGVGHFELVDPDTVEASNVSRLVGATEDDVDQFKVDVLGRHVVETVKTATASTHRYAIEDCPHVLDRVDLVVAGVDRVSARSFLNQECLQQGVPYIDAGTRIDTDEDEVTGMQGFVQVILPGETACFDCLGRGDPEQARREHLDDEELAAEVERGYLDRADVAPEPAVVHLNAVTASLAVNELVKLVTGMAELRGFIRFDALDLELVGMHTDRSDGCITCQQLLG